MKRPIIGITTMVRVNTESVLEEHIVNEQYIKMIEQAGGIPIILPLVQEAEAIMRQVSLCEGVLVSGGSDVNPLLYGREPQKNLGYVHMDLDRYQIKIIQETLAQNKPLLGICRGMQLLNVSLGGTLIQDLEGLEGILKHRQSSKRTEPAHHIQVEKSSQVYRILGERPLVNSLHHQAVEILGKGLKVTAVAEDGVVEMIELTGESWGIGVQWHPEALVDWDEKQFQLVRTFIEYSQER